jgi:hypothetical protein
MGHPLKLWPSRKWSGIATKPETVRRTTGLYPVLMVYDASIAVPVNNFKYASGTAATRPRKVPLYGAKAGSILRRLLKDKA